MGLVDILSNLCCVIAIPIIGKRTMMLLGLTGVCVFCFCVAANAYHYLTFDTSSFHPPPLLDGQEAENHYAFPLFICLGVSASVSGLVPWMMNSEVYPFRYTHYFYLTKIRLKTKKNNIICNSRIRGTASGLTSAFAYVTLFLATKLYINFEQGFTIFGSFIVYGCITFFG